VEMKIRDIVSEKMLVSLNLDEVTERVFQGQDDPYSVGERIMSRIRIGNSG
jgi:hypothetical protein